jgi:hypothetical protein
VVEELDLTKCSMNICPDGLSPGCGGPYLHYAVLALDKPANLNHFNVSKDATHLTIGNVDFGDAALLLHVFAQFGKEALPHDVSGGVAVVDSSVSNLTPLADLSPGDYTILRKITRFHLLKLCKSPNCSNDSQCSHFSDDRQPLWHQLRNIARQDKHRLAARSLRPPLPVRGRHARALLVYRGLDRRSRTTRTAVWSRSTSRL